MGVVAGTLGVETCAPSAPVSVVMIHGTEDRAVLYDGGASPSSGYRRVDLSVADTVSFWARHNECADAPHRTQRGSVEQTSYCEGQEGADVVLYTMQGGRHTWPAAPFSATAQLWEFFSTHRNRL